MMTVCGYLVVRKEDADSFHMTTLRYITCVFRADSPISGFNTCRSKCVTGMPYYSLACIFQSNKGSLVVVDVIQ